MSVIEPSGMTHWVDIVHGGTICGRDLTGMRALQVSDLTVTCEQCESDDEDDQ